ncbi:WecB/TagA/CpsF family glycosyltransferase [Halocella sp. SP3-1]|uniref:WecB/TagA/CpsF family glycosyltransferase n=1 Tax=Halocella sp. SP3-1 TaxID=2382161 RepID=UPI000F7522EA|nr:WecB/TagA/CpsF family glycosyltransferase [Halocella sp. SP3-1]AZO94086.1 glycosyltransferase [Halocella sp. SP3-1]
MILLTDYKIEILGVQIDQIKMEAAVKRVDKYINAHDNKRYMIVTPNAEMIVMAYDNPGFADILNRADLSVPDGAGVVLASHILTLPLEERVAGFDLMGKLLKLAQEKDYRVFFLGGKDSVLEKALNKIKNNFPGLKIAGSHHGYLDPALTFRLIEEINGLDVDILFVGMGVPLQERFLNDNLANLKVKVAMTVGGSFDVLADEVKRAPRWMQTLGLEWLFRLIQEPSRIGRMMALPRFVLLVFKEYLLAKVRR